MRFLNRLYFLGITVSTILFVTGCHSTKPFSCTWLNPLDYSYDSLTKGEKFYQDSLCYDKIDQLASEYNKEKFGIRVNGEYTDRGKYREFYLTDSTRTTIVALHISVTDKNNLSETTGFYFYKGELILAERFKWNGSQKYDMERHYYLQGKCAQPGYNEQEMTKKLFFLRIAHLYKLNFENGIVKSPN